MERTYEEEKFVTLVVPKSINSGATETGAYKALTPNGLHDVLFNVPFGVLAATKIVTVQVWQADDDSGTNAEEIEAAETVYTSPGGGVTQGQILISIPLNYFSREYATVKIINGAATGLLAFAEMVIEQAVRNASVNSQASALTVL